MKTTTVLQGFKKAKKFGKLTENSGIGSQCNIKARLLEAKIETDKEGLPKKSKNGANRIALRLEVGGIKFNAVYYETQYAPSFNDIKKAQFVVLNISNGGEGASEVYITNFKNEDGSNSCVLKLCMPNISIVNENNEYEVYNGSMLPFALDNEIVVSFKGVINFNADDDFDTWCAKGFYNFSDNSIHIPTVTKDGEYSYFIPIRLKDITEDLAIKIFQYLKENYNNVFAFKTKISLDMVDIVGAEDGEFGIDNTEKEFYFYADVVRNEKGKLQFTALDNQGTLLISTDRLEAIAENIIYEEDFAF